MVRLYDKDYIIRRQTEYIRRLEIENRKLERLAKWSVRDTLTGVGNRRRMDMALHSCIVEVQRRKQDFCIVIIDLDGLREMNNVHGHHAGDQYLKKAADLLQDVAREGEDIVCRFGGDEFMIIMPNTSYEHGMHLVSRINEQSAIHNIPMSAGISSFSEHSQLSESNDARSKGIIKKMKKAADMRMYAMKKAHKAHAAKAHEGAGNEKHHHVGRAAQHVAHR